MDNLLSRDRFSDGSPVVNFISSIRICVAAVAWNFMYKFSTGLVKENVDLAKSQVPEVVARVNSMGIQRFPSPNDTTRSVLLNSSFPDKPKERT